MSELKEFRELNELTQLDIAKYLGISKSFVSQVEKGKVKLPKEKFNLLLENPMGWNTIPLTLYKKSSLSQEVPVVVEEVIGEEVPMAIPIIPAAIIDDPSITIQEYMDEVESDCEKFDLEEIRKYVDIGYRIRTEKLAPHINIGDIVFFKKLRRGQDIHYGEPCIVDTSNLGGLLRYVFKDGENLRLTANNRTPDIIVPLNKVEGVWQMVGRYTPTFSMPDYLSNKIITKQGEQITSLLDSVNNLVTATIDEGKRTDRVLDLLEKEIERNAKK